MRIVHISDFHLSADDKSYYSIDPLFVDLHQINIEKKIDLFIFSGDLIDKGGYTFDDTLLGFMTFEEIIIQRIEKEFSLTSDKFIISPGNHDVDINLDNKFSESGLKNELTSTTDVKEFQENLDNYTNIERIKPYKEFEKELYRNYSNVNVTKFETVHSLTMLEKKVSVVSLNTSWRCYDSESDKGNLILGENQIINNISAIENADVKIAVMHHHYDHLKSFESKSIRDLLNRHFDLVLTGHVHETDTIGFQVDSNTTIFSTSSSNTVFNASTENIYENAYNYIDINDEDIVISSRQYIPRKNKFVPNVTVGDDNGQLHFKKENTKDITMQTNIDTAIQSIKEIYGVNANAHLLSYSTDSNAPKDINSLFVKPKIIEKKTDGSKEDIEINDKVEKDYTLEEICKSEKNIIFTGQKESGKTVLLDKLLLEFSSHYYKYKKIPVLLDFNKIKNESMLVLFAEYLHISQTDLKKDFLIRENIVLMIDNFDSTRDIKKMRKVEAFMLSYPKTQLFITTMSSYEESFPLYSSEYKFDKEILVLSIEGFRTKEIHKLIKKWFSSNEIEQRQLSADDIVSRFNRLNLPSTPLAISMFLWIVEKQGSYSPVNNAQMLDNFLERLLQKNEAELVYREDFTYENKKNLLTHIAYFMYEKGTLEYRVSYDILKKEIDNYFDRRTYYFNVVDIIDEFLDLGILIAVKDDSKLSIKFRFSCFFQFYLMKNIDQKPLFKEFILTDDNCINFISELDYYTGLSMQDSTLLKIISEKMVNKFKSLKTELLDSTPYGYDGFFETTQSYTSKLNDTKINEITYKIKESPDKSEEINDNLLKNTEKHSVKIDHKESSMNPLKFLENYWTLTGVILKNSEDIDDPELKNKSLGEVVDCSLIFVTLIKALLIQSRKETIAEEGKNSKFLKRYNFIYSFLPYVHQDLLSKVITTSKLSTLLKEKLDTILTQDNITDLEKFTYTFLYFDLKGKGNDKYDYVDKLMKNMNRIYTKDIIFLNLLSVVNAKLNTTNIAK